MQQHERVLARDRHAGLDRERRVVGAPSLALQRPLVAVRMVDGMDERQQPVGPAAGQREAEHRLGLRVGGDDPVASVEQQRRLGQRRQLVSVHL